MFAFGLLISAFSGICFAQLDSAAAPACTAADLDGYPKFTNAPPSAQAVGIDFRNTSGHPCMLPSGMGAIFHDWTHQFNILNECRNCTVEGYNGFRAPLSLAPNEIAHMVFRWKTASGTITCHDAQGFTSNFYSVHAASLISPVCSVVNIDSFLPGPFMVEHESANNVTENVQKPTVKLEAPASVLYAGDNFSLSVTVDDPTGRMPLDNNSCPTILLRTALGLEQMYPQGKCEVSEENNGQDHSTVMTISSVGVGALNIPRRGSILMYALAGPAHAASVSLIASNPIDLVILDPAAVQYQWGPLVQGVGAALSLDKETYALGEDIPLRVAIESFSADKTIESGECLRDDITVDVRDEAGKPVSSPLPGTAICAGHGWAFRCGKGTPMTIPNMTLRWLGMLPNKPGKYTVMATWTSYVASGQAATEGGKPACGYVSGLISSGPPTSAKVEAELVAAHSRMLTFHIAGGTRQNGNSSVATLPNRSSTQ
jgi:hypothetical protein